MRDSDGYRFRDLVPGDVAALASLHVATFKETHGVHAAPTFELRQRQWNDLFRAEPEAWFCVGIENPDGVLIGFARGVPYVDEPGSPYGGLLNKIYLLRDYQGLGLGRKLVGHVAGRFLERNITAMLLFGDADSPSNGFYEALGAHRLLTEKGEFHGGYGWLDLQNLAKICPI